MDSNFDFIESIQEDFIENEKTFHKLGALNEYIKINTENILLVNIRSIDANFNKLQVFLESLETKPNVIVCTETRVLENYLIYGLDGYKIYYNHSNINVTDGVVLYIREGITEETNTVNQGRLSIINSTIFLNNKNKLLISALYRAHDLPIKDFISDLKNFLETFKNIKNHIILGDFNIDLLKLDSLCMDHLNNLLERGFKPSFRTITRPSIQNPNNGSCIDNVFTKINNIETKGFKYANLFNDHYPLFLSVKTMGRMSGGRHFVPINFDRLNRIAGNTDWSSILSVHDPDEATDILINRLQNCVESAKVTSNKRNKKPNSSPRKKWITPAILISCNRKEFLYHLWKKDPDNIYIKNYYRDYSKILSKVIKAAKRIHDRDTIKNNIGNSRNLWNVINDIIGNKPKKKDEITYIVNSHNQKVYDSTDISNLMNSFFCNIGTELSDKIQTPPNSYLVLPNINPKTIFISPTTSHEIYNIIEKMKLKNGGVDSIHMKVIKKLANYIVDPIVHIINTSIEKSIWPDSLKCADIKPIFKSKNSHVISNYRPISLISNIAKIFEKVLYYRILDFVKKSKLLSKKQFGFLKNVGTKDALNYITNLIYEKLDKSLPIAVSFLDLAKAFDTVNHKILLDKLYNYGIRGNAFKLISSYLQNRRQRVKVNGVLSDFCEVNTGVPQGTILGPLFFILYINDLLVNMPEDIIISFADDTAVISTDKTWQLVEEKMNNQLALISDWLALNKLSLNIDKTVYITFGNYCDSVPHEFTVKINGMNVNRVESCKYLGIYFDYRMRWENHIQYILSKTKYLVFLFHKFSKFMSTETLLMIYYAFFHSVINYGIVSWGGCCSTNLNMLQRLQTKLTKIVFNSDASVDKMPLNMKQLFAFDSLTYHYNKLKDLYCNSTSITRNKNLPLPKISKAVGSKSSIYKATYAFNSLADELKTLNNVKSKSYKSKLKKWIKTNL